MFVFNLPKLIWNVLSEIRIFLANVLGDPSVSANIHGKKMYMPFSHNLPIYVHRFKYYDTALTRIAEYIRPKSGGITYIDVGANIGDSILAINPRKEDKIIGIEPNPKFEKYLRKNLKGLDNVIIENVICSSISQKENMKILEKNGTASVIEDKDSNLVVKDTLDNIVKRNNIEKIDLLKTDTDGHDFEVLRGATELIKKDMPTILFECDSFGNKNYVDDVLELFDFLLKCGYKSIIMYDNFGYLFGRYDLRDKNIFKNFLFYQLNSDFYYFDILVMREVESTRFFASEKEFFDNN